MSAQKWGDYHILISVTVSTEMSGFLLIRGSHPKVWCLLFATHFGGGKYPWHLPFFLLIPPQSGGNGTNKNMGREGDEQQRESHTSLHHCVRCCWWTSHISIFLCQVRKPIGVHLQMDFICTEILNLRNTTDKCNASKNMEIK
jgi:hypothetical protein